MTAATWDAPPEAVAAALRVSVDAVHAALRDGWLSGDVEGLHWVVALRVPLERIEAEGLSIWDATAYETVVRVSEHPADLAADAERATAAGWSAVSLATTLRRDPWGLLFGLIGFWLFRRTTCYHVLFRRVAEVD